MNTILEIVESSVNIWEKAFFDASNNLGTTSDLLGYIFALIQGGVEGILNFIEDFLNFYSMIFSFNFEIINTTGYILALIFLLTPVLLVVLLIYVLKQIRGKIGFNFLNPRNLFLLLLIIPFAPQFLWIPALFALALVFYYVGLEIKEGSDLVKKKDLILLINWKKAFLLLLFTLILLIEILQTILPILFDPELDTTLLSFFSLKSNDVFILILMFSIFFIFILPYIEIIYLKYGGGIEIEVKNILGNIPFLFIQGKKPKERLKNFVFPSVYMVITYIILFAIIIPCFDSIFLQSSISDILFIILNFPWIIGLMALDPLQFFGLIITAIKTSFDIIVSAMRNIMNGFIPTVPTDNSILSALQPFLFQINAIFLVFLIIYTLIMIILSKQHNPVKSWKMNVKEFNSLILLILVCFISFVILFILNPETFYSIYGDPYAIQTDPWFKELPWTAILLILLLSLSISGIAFALAWIYIQIVVKKRSKSIIAKIIMINALVVVIAIIMIVPFIWMIKNSLQTEIQNSALLEEQGFIPDPLTLSNYAQLFGLFEPPYETLEYRVVTWLFNSLVTAVGVTAFLVIFSAMAGYCLAKRNFVGRNVILVITVGIMFVPSYVQVIPLYLELNRLGFVGSLLGVIFPFLIQPFSVFLCTEFMRSIPDDYLDAARVDGYSEFQIFWKIVLPLSIPVISVMTIINFIGNWNAFLWPLLILDQSALAPMLRTLPLGIYRINDELQEQAGVVLALATIIVIPIFVLLFLAQDYIKRGVTIEGLKG
jgi:multiple sugar transport system permease protein